MQKSTLQQASDAIFRLENRWATAHSRQKFLVHERRKGPDQTGHR